LPTLFAPIVVARNEPAAPAKGFAAGEPPKISRAAKFGDVSRYFRNKISGACFCVANRDAFDVKLSLRRSIKNRPRAITGEATYGPRTPQVATMGQLPQVA
jgi:hypothetical protein